ncbi:LysR family transcriptional regulator [Sphingomonas sp. DT-51]|uniref:LysR family transcriptional regulator n=1 Tax=Sphingomonas sp. DT-51 TaxID=3396165 RepID=UPI003F1CBCDA
MMKLDPVQTFVEVVRAGGFTAAARRIGMPRSTVSLQIRNLETALEARLFKRTTRSLVLTDEGERLYARAAGAIDDLTQVMDDLKSTPDTLRGLIRVTAPADFPTGTLADSIASFSRLHPEVRFQVTLTNQALDLVRENIDIAVRVGAGRSQDAVERRLLDIAWGFYAGEPWLERNGRPADLDQIRDFISPTPALRAYLESVVLGGATLPPGIIRVDSHVMARDLMLRGFGVALLPVGLCTEALRRGEAEALPGLVVTNTTRLNLTFPNRADIVPRVRAFAEHVLATFGSV